VSESENQSPTTEAPSGEYQVMSDAFAQPKEEPKTFDSASNIDNVRDAADERLRKRQQQDPEPVERHYVNYETGEKMDGNQTVSLERASDDLTRQRGFEAQQVEDTAKSVFAFGIDAVREGHDPVELLKQQVEQQASAEQPQPEAQPEIQPQPQSEQPPEVAELAAELERSPRLKAALAEEAQRIQQVHSAASQAQQEFLQAADQAKQFAVTTLLASFPEFRGVSVEQLPAALQILKANNPERHASAIEHLARVDSLGKAQQQAEAQAQQQTQAALQQWAAREDKVVDEYLAKNESPEVIRNVKNNVLKVVTSYGVDESDFRQAIASVPLLRSAPFQRMLFDVVKQHTLREQVAEKVAKPAVPVVQRPGSSQRTSAAESELAAARERFLKNPDDMRLAANYVAAKRAANS
jgi:hypothetical protein